MFRQPSVWIGSLLALAIGCNAPLNYQKSKVLKSGEEAWEIAIDAAKYKQTLKIEVASPDAPVNVHVYLEKNADKASAVIMSGQESEILLGKELKTEKAELKIDVPPSEATIIRIKNISPKEASVQVKITN